MGMDKFHFNEISLQVVATTIKYRSGELSDERIKQLEDADLSGKPDPMEQEVSELVAYAEKGSEMCLQSPITR